MQKPIDLKDGTLALKVCLKKGWSKKPTYWVEVWQVPVKIGQVTKVQWVCNRSWKFTRKDRSTGKAEDMAGSVPYDGKSSFYLAYEQAVNSVDIQLEKDYTIDTVRHKIDAIKPLEHQEILETIKGSMKRWSEFLKKPIPLVFTDGSAMVIGQGNPKIKGKATYDPDMMTTPPPLPPTGFKAAQAKRAKKARW